MSTPDAPGDDDAVLERMDAGIQAAMDAVQAKADDEAAIRFAGRAADLLHSRLVALGDVRGVLAMRLRENRKLSFTALGEIMSVTRARAAEIVDKARKRDPATRAPVVTLAVITGPRGVLLSKRTDRTPPWSFIGGEVEPGETPEQAAVREVREETGAEVIAVEVIGHRTHPATGRDVSYVACRLADPDAEVTVTDTGELAEVRWADLGDARLLMPTLYRPVDEFLARTLRG